MSWSLRADERILAASCAAVSAAARDDDGLGGPQDLEIEIKGAQLKERLEDGLVTKPAKLFREDASVGLGSRYKEAHTR